jgi:hypothetical protein
MAIEFKISTKGQVLHNSKKIISNDIFDLIILDTGYTYRLFSDNFKNEDNRNFKNSLGLVHCSRHSLRHYLIDNEILDSENFIEDEDGNYITRDNNGVDLMYISDASCWTKGKHMVEFCGNEKDKKLFQSLDITISEGIGIKNAGLGMGFRVFEILKSLHYCAIFDISDLEIYTHTFEDKVYKIARLDIDSESG